jgi:hypothetical protein
MSTSNSSQALYSTPVFELFRRGLSVQTIKNFRGINVYQSVTVLSAEHALDCLNVMIPGTGGVSKFRLPVQLADVPNGVQPAGPYQIFDFQKVDGTRQVVGTFAQSLYYYTWATPTTLSAGTLIDNAAADAQPWSMVEANQTLYGANGVQMKKWTGAAWYNWGIAAPTNVPTIGSLPRQLSSIQRTANVVTFTIRNDVISGDAAYLQVGDMVTIVNPPDVSYNGTFAIATVVVPGLTYTYAQVAGNTAAYLNVATVQFPSSSGVVPGIVTGSRTAGVATYSWTPQLDVDPAAIVGTTITISGFADASLNGTFEVASATQLFTGTNAITVAQAGLPDSAGGINGTLTLGVNIQTSRTYAISFITNLGTPSNIGPTVTLKGPVVNRIVYIQGTPNPQPDAQISGFQLFATLDGGGDLFIDRCTVIPLVYIRDFIIDAELDPTVQGPLIHNPPPVGKYLTVGQSRVFIGNIVGDPTAIAYSGFEQIVYPGARPEECFPPSNRLRLNIGAEAVAGVGVLQTGVVGFSATKKMYMLRGNVEDIVVTAPVAFSAFLEELPWNIGTMCHQSIQATPYGLIFWASDRTVQLFDGHRSLDDISGPVYPILRRATAGYESVASSAYFNWLERDWYGLCFPIDGSHSNNYTIFWALNKSTMAVEIFPCSIPIDSLSTISTSALQRILAIGQNGKIMNLPVSQDTIGGIADVTVIPATNVNLAAYWRSGYFGNESPVRQKMFRRGLAVTDTDGFSVTQRTVNNKTNKVTNPKIIAKKKLKDGSFSINDHAARLSVEINFPDKDVSCNLMELSVGAIPTSDRL